MEKVGKLLRTSLLKEIEDSVQTKNNTFLLTYSAITASQINDLRKDLKQAGADMFVSRNRLARLALTSHEQEEMAGTIKGQTAFVWSDADAVTVSKLLTDFAKKYEGFQIQGGLLDGSYLNKAAVDRLAHLPSREVLQAQLLQMMLAPLTRLAGALNAKSRDLLSILKQLSEKKGGS